MLKKILLPLIVLCFSLSARANSVTNLAAAPEPQTPAPSIMLTWTLSTGTGVTSQNVYRAACTGTVTGTTCSTDSTATFTKLSAGTGIAATLTTFTDTTVSVGQGYIYYVTAVCPATGACVGESAPSNHAAAAVPGTPPPPPSGLTIGSVTATVNGANQTVLARWSDTNAVAQYFAFTNGTRFINQGLTSSLTGTFAEEVVAPAGTTVTFLACDATGICASQTVN